MSERGNDENLNTRRPPVAHHGPVSPRTQVVLIAVGIALFNVVLIGLLVFIFVVY